PGHTKYQAMMATRPSSAVSNRTYPLTLGTYRQTAKLCPRCGRGEHDRAVCQGTPLDGKEIEWRTSAREMLLGGGDTSVGERKSLYQILLDEGYDEGEAGKIQAVMGSGNVSGQ
ncbi:hypothetical protein RSAG8_13858, partial [Rhizoctonia solani AG-8 WAC10335]